MNTGFQFRLLIAAFLLVHVMGSGAVQNVKKDTLNVKQVVAQLDSIKNKLQQSAIACKPRAAALVMPKIVGYGSIVTTRSKNHAVFGDYLIVKIDSIPALLALTDSIAGKKRDTLSEIILYINGNAMYDMAVVNFDKEEHELLFHLDRNSKFLIKFFPEFPYLWSTLPVSVSAGYKSGLILPVEPGVKPLSLEYVSRGSMIFSIIFIITILVTFIILAATSNLIRIADDNSPFSLALTQLAFWSIVIASSFIYIWIVTDALPPITGSTLVLLSVSALTTAGAKLVDIRAGSNNQLARSISFLEDILQDEIGYSVHRAQMFMWTVIMVIIFVTNVIRFQQIPQLDESLLALMGISSGTYVGLKTMENKKDAPAATL